MSNNKNDYYIEKLTESSNKYQINKDYTPGRYQWLINFIVALNKNQISKQFGTQKIIKSKSKTIAENTPSNPVISK